jgi:hypothetical protein
MAEGEGAQSGADGAQSGTVDSTTDGTDVTGSTSGNGTQSGAGTVQPTEADGLRAELEKQRQRTLASDRRAAEIDAQLKQLRDKDLPEAEKLKRDHEEAVKTVEKLTNTNRELALKVAFLGDNTYSWHNPERAMRLIDLSQVTIDDDGAVSGLKDALNALAKSDAYLIKADGEDVAKTPPGTAPGNNGTNGTGGPKKGAMASRLPVMGTRVNRG